MGMFDFNLPNINIPTPTLPNISIPNLPTPTLPNISLPSTNTAIATGASELLLPGSGLIVAGIGASNPSFFDNLFSSFHLPSLGGSGGGNNTPATVGPLNQPAATSTKQYIIFGVVFMIIVIVIAVLIRKK